MNIKLTDEQKKLIDNLACQALAKIGKEVKGIVDEHEESFHEGKRCPNVRASAIGILSGYVGGLTQDLDMTVIALTSDAVARMVKAGGDPEQNLYGDVKKEEYNFIDKILDALSSLSK